jgi:hypothetical protein
MYYRTVARELIETYTSAVPPKEIEDDDDDNESDDVVRRRNNSSSSSQRRDLTTDKANGKQQVDDEDEDDNIYQLTVTDVIYSIKLHGCYYLYRHLHQLHQINITIL